jgi:CRP/FNR family transcriptional regulator
MALTQILASLEPFKHLSAQERQQLSDAAREKRYSKGETVFRAGESAEFVYLVLKGRVHLMKFLISGQASTTCVMTDQELVCCLPTLDGKPYPVDAGAAVDSTLARIPTQAFHALMQKNSRFMRATLGMMCGRLRDVEEGSCRSFDSVERRLAGTLLNLSKKFGSTIPLTKHELAEMANTTVETTIRVLSQMKKERIISSTRGSTTIDDPRQLSRLAGT